MDFIQVFWNFSLEITVETSILSLTYQNSCFWFARFLSFTETLVNILACIWCSALIDLSNVDRKPPNVHLMWTIWWDCMTDLHSKTFWCELIVACCACYYFFFLFLWPFVWPSWFLMSLWELYRILSLTFRHWSHVN